jgi:crotonobetainyl-CoA:carnitine CoA-transferase CaiB-like acyl-CoA transferase
VDEERSEPLFAGLKVIDAASYIAAPASATILADFGADVIKIEPPGTGDDYRHISNLPGMPQSNENYCWTVDDRNKRSIALDLKQKAGQGVLHRLVAAADVFITNYPLEVRRRLGLAYDQLSHINERLVYASMTAYGEEGPEATKRGFDSTAWWARSGLMDLVRPYADATPARSVPGMGDHPTALAMYGAIVTALYRRTITGKGAYVGSSLMASGLWANACFVQAALDHARFVDRPPRAKPYSALSNQYLCKDGRWLLLSLSIQQDEKGWPRFTHALGREHLTHDPRFATRPLRLQNAAQLLALLDEVFMTRDAREWMEALEAAGFTIAVVARTADALGDPQALANAAVVPLEGGRQTVSSPLWLKGSPKVPARRAPELGEHSDAILRAQGYDEAEIKRLRESGAVG